MFGDNNYGHFPWPFGMPQQTVVQRVEEKAPPIRVQVAMTFLRHLSAKTQAGAVPHGVGAVEIDGQRLVPAEIGAQTAACELLKKYFHGDLSPSVWEERDENPDQGQGRAGKIVLCPFCQGGKDPRCTFCQGRGNVLIYAVGTPGDEGG